MCKYLDIALQHTSDVVLQNMRRHISKQQQIDLIEKIRAEVPGIALRTTLMVGYPGEGDEEFAELMDFVSKMRFERMGAFAYSEEEDTYAAQHFKDEIPEEVKQERLSRLMALQQDISEAYCAEKIGKHLKVIIDRKEGEYFIGRTEYDSPEVDGEVFVKSDKYLRKGSFHSVLITDSTEFDLYGKV